jgi:hypothetical protein
MKKSPHVKSRVGHFEDETRFRAQFCQKLSVMLLQTSVRERGLFDRYVFPASSAYRNSIPSDVKFPLLPPLNTTLKLLTHCSL